MVLRRIQSIIPSLQSLGLSPIYADLAMEKRGLVLVVGPTGSGTTWISLKVQNGAGTTIMTKVAINTSTLRSPVSTDFLYAPTDNTSIAAMPNETIVMPATGFGAETITGFNTAQGVIELPHAIAGSFAAVQAHEAASGGGTLISFGPSESIFLPGIAPTALHAANFSFA